MVTLEQVEKLRERTNVTYDEAKAALESTNGDLLDAIIFLEKQGKVKAPEDGGYYSNEKKEITDYKQPSGNAKKENKKGETFGGLLHRFGRFCLKMIQKGNNNTFDVYKGEECKASLPITVLILLLIFAFWVIIPLIIIGLFFGLRYRFTGPDLGHNCVNNAMDSAAKVAEDIKHSVSNENK